MGVDTSGAAFNIPVEAGDREHIERLLTELKGKPFIVVSPGAKSHVKRWHLKNFAKLCDMIKKKLGYEIALIGDQSDRVVIDRVLFYMETEPLNLIEKTNIGQLACLIKKSRLLITNDSAPLHVAGAAAGNILAFFGPTEEKKYWHLTKGKGRVLRRNLWCSPCEVAQCVNKKNKYECLKAISPEEAFRAVKELLTY